MPGPTTRPAARGTRAMVAAPHALATRSGLEALQRGGSAVDACIAMNATLCVVYGHMAGLGGDLFAQVWDPVEGRLAAINGSGRSGEKLTIEAYLRRDHREIPARGPLAAITVPGAVDGWARLHERYGRLEWATLFGDAIRHAEQGVAVSPNLHAAIGEAAAALRPFEACRQVFLPDGRAPDVGSRLPQPDLADSLRLIAEAGPDAFYRGQLAERIVAGLRAAGGLLTLDDLASHASDWVEPLRASYRGLEVTELPPNSQGLAALLILNLIEATDLRALGDASAETIHLVVEATKLAFADRDRWITDPATLVAPLDELLSTAYTAERRRAIDPRRAADDEPPAVGLRDGRATRTRGDAGDTVYVCAVDADGQACSLIESLFFELGSGFMPPGTGILLQNRGVAFRLEPDHPNALRPQKRTFHTLMPAMAFRGDQPALLFGTMGGEGQPQTQAAILTRIVDFDLDVQSAIDAPRWRYGRAWGEPSRTLKLEGRIPDATAAELGRRGHVVEVVEDWSSRMGHAQAIWIDRDRGSLHGGADPRGDGLAAGW